MARGQAAAVGSECEAAGEAAAGRAAVDSFVHLPSGHDLACYRIPKLDAVVIVGDDVAVVRMDRYLPDPRLGLEMGDRFARRGLPDADAARRVISRAVFLGYFRDDADRESAVRRKGKWLIDPQIQSFELGEF